MYSIQIKLIRAAEFTACTLGFASLLIGTLVKAQWVEPQIIEPYVFSVFLMMFPIFGFSVYLMAQFVKIMRSGQSWFQQAHKLSWVEAKEIVRFCPRWLLLISLTGAVAAVVIGYSVGKVTWRTGMPFTEREAIGFSTGSALFYFLSLPILGSASRSD